MRRPPTRKKGRAYSTRTARARRLVQRHVVLLAVSLLPGQVFGAGREDRRGCQVEAADQVGEEGGLLAHRIDQREGDVGPD